MLAGFPTSGTNDGILTSGDVELADDPNGDGGNGFGTVPADTTQRKRPGARMSPRAAARLQ